MSSIARSFKYRCYPTDTQIATLAAWQEACYEVQRLCIIQRRIAWRKRTTLYGGAKPERPQPSRASQGREVTQLRGAYAYLADVPADTMSAVVKRVDMAYQRMMKDWKAGKRSKVRWADSAADVGLVFRGSKRGTQVVTDGARLTGWSLAGARKLGVLAVRMHRPMPEGTAINQAHITRAADGWYISFSCEIPAPAPAPPAPRPVNGVDVNVKHDGNRQEIAAVDDGRTYRTPAGLKVNAKRLATLQRMVDPKRKVAKGKAKAADPASKRTAKRRARIARLHQRIARQREHVQQYAARRLVDTADTTVFEKLNHQGMRRKGKGRRKRGLNRALSTAAPGRLIALTREKAQVAGRVVETVDPRNTSQQCSVCGAIGAHKGLNVRRWTCATCGTAHDRDVNAARNIKRRFELSSSVIQPETLKMPGEGAAGNARKRPSANLEAAYAAAPEIPAHPSISHTGSQLTPVFWQQTSFEDLPDAAPPLPRPAAKRRRGCNGIP